VCEDFSHCGGDLKKMNEDQTSVQKPYPISYVVAGFVNFVLFIHLLANWKGFLFGETVRSLADTPGSPAGLVICFFFLIFYLWLLAMYLLGAIFGALVVVFKKKTNWGRTLTKWLTFTPIILTILFYLGRAIIFFKP
jgi:hypothetical protein